MADLFSFVTNTAADGTTSPFLTDYSSMVGTGQFVLTPTSLLCEDALDDVCLPAASNILAATDEDSTTPELVVAVKDLVVKVLPHTLAEKEARSYALKNIPKGVLISVVSFKSYLAEQLGLLTGISDVGYYVRGGKKVWLKSGEDLVEVLEQINGKGRGSIWCVEKAVEEDNDDTVQKAKKKRYDGEERRERVQGRFEALKKHHGTKYSAPQYRFWAEALEVGLHTSIEDPPRGKMFDGTVKDAKKPNELRETLTDLAKVITGVMTGHKTPPLRNSPSKQTDAPSSPNVSRPLKVAELKSRYIQQVKDLYGLYEVGAISQEDFDKQKGLILDQMSSC